LGRDPDNFRQIIASLVHRNGARELPSGIPEDPQPLAGEPETCASRKFCEILVGKK
jgi:hypothetical protein